MDELKRIERSALQRIKRAKSLDALAVLRAELLGRRGLVGDLRRRLAEQPALEHDKSELESRVAQLKARLEDALARAVELANQRAIELELETGRFDVTLPGRRFPAGSAHPLRQIEAEVVASLRTLGFDVVDSPHIETEWHNFEALNMSQEHPARDLHRPFVCEGDAGFLLRTHTSTAQVRAMMAQSPPLRVISSGMVFRRTRVDATHVRVFHQVEGLWVDESASFADLKGVLTKIIGDLFDGDVNMRFRPSYSPYTEPSAEVDLSCTLCSGTGSVCRVCRGSGWLEVIGGGMVHPEVLKAVGYSPERSQGFSFSVGIERLAMLRWRVDDIRLFCENDLRFLHQFSAGR